MGYSIRDKFGDPTPLRMIIDRRSEDPAAPFQIGTEVTPCDWTVDPCAPQHKRIEVTWRSDLQISYYAWWEVIFHDDSAEDIELKLKTAAEVKRLRLEYQRARDNYSRVLGRGPEIVPR